MKSIFLLLFFFGLPLCAAPIKTTAALLHAIESGDEGQTIELASGTFELDQSLELKPGTTLRGAGMDQTILTHTDSWTPSLKSLPDPETQSDRIDTAPYLIRLERGAKNVTISNLTLTAPRLHGALFARSSKKLHLHDLRIRDLLWSGIRLQAAEEARIHDCEFIDAGGRWKRGGLPGVDGGITGGGIFAIWIKDSEIFNNRFTRTQSGKENSYFGIKGRQAKRCRIHHNTIEVNFSIEFPFENDEDNEIDHNICAGTISIPKHAGGPVPESGRTFHIHHNYFRDSYSIEFVRNGVEIDHNLFDFDLAKDHGNTISGFGKAPAKGPASFHNNLVSNPGRGVIWINEPYSNFEIRNNHIITRTTATPRKEGLFGFNPKSDFSTIRIRSNRIVCEGQSRPLLRKEESYESSVENNHFVNVADSGKFEHKPTGETIGLEEPLQFRCGVDGELTIDGWKSSPTPPDAQK